MFLFRNASRTRSFGSTMCLVYYLHSYDAIHAGVRPFTILGIKRTFLGVHMVPIDGSGFPEGPLVLLLNE